MLIEDTKETERKALEAYLGDPRKLAFSLPEAAKILGRSDRWARQKTADGKLKSIWVGGQRRITRPTIIEALMEGVEE
jgi:excisionase family DNA binding protein